jgi:uncharacterized protein
VVVGALAGVVAGSQLSEKLPERVLKIVVALLMVVGAIKELHDGFLGGGATAAIASASSPAGGGPARYVLLTLTGLVIGMLSGLSGVGGGVILVPILVLAFGLGQRAAQGTSLLAILPSSALGAIVHHTHREVNVRAAVQMSITGAPAALVGAFLALWLPQRALAGMFGLFLVFAAFRLWPRPRDAKGARPTPQT